MARNCIYMLSAGVLAFSLTIPALANAQSVDLSPPDISGARVSPTSSGYQQPYVPQQQPPTSGETPLYVLLMNSLDETGIPQGLPYAEAEERFGPHGAALLAQDDVNRCNSISTLRENERRLRALEVALRVDEEALANAQTEAERENAERNVRRSRRNLWDFILSIGQIGLGIALSDGDMMYGGLVGLGVVQNHLRGRTSDEAMDAFYQQLRLYAQQQGLYDRRLELFDQRLQISSAQGEFWYYVMEGYCNQYVLRRRF